MEVERSKNNSQLSPNEPLNNADQIKNALLTPAFIELLASKLKENLLPWRKTQNDKESNPQTDIPLICWGCKKHGHKKIHCPETSCFYCGKRGHCKRICLTYRLARWYDQEKDAAHKHKPLQVRYKLPLPELNNSHNSNSSASNAINLITPPNNSKPRDPTNNSAFQDGGLMRPATAAFTTTLNKQETETPKRKYAPNLKATKSKTAKFRPVSTYAQRKTCYKCPECPCKFMDKQNLLEHLKQTHQINEPKTNGYRIYIHDQSKWCSHCTKTGKHIKSYNLAKIECGKTLCFNCLYTHTTIMEDENEGYSLLCPICEVPHHLKSYEGILMEILAGYLDDDILVSFDPGTCT